jgi:hypothetical protein
LESGLNKAVPGNTRSDFENSIRTIIAFLIIIGGMVCGVWLTWWLSVEGDIIEIMHRMKMGLPGWVWQVLKYGLSFAFGLAFIFAFLILGMAVIGGRRRR